MLFHLMQTAITAEEIARRQDSVMADVSRFAEGLVTNPKGTLSVLLDRTIDFGLKLLAAIIIYIVGAWLIRRVKQRLTKVFLKKNTDKAVASFAGSFISISLTILLILVVVGTLGINTTSIAALLAAGGMAIGMALSGTVQNFAGGIMILVFRPFRVGDYITAQGFSGTVSGISIVNTTLQSSDGHTLFVPNGALFNGNIDNYTRRGLRRVEWTVNLEYGTDSVKAIKLMNSIVKSDSRVLDSTCKGAKDVFVSISNLGASSVDFVVRAWVKESDYWDVFYEMNCRFYTELPKGGFSFPFPQLDVRINS